jgi:hypothetical protein
VVCPALLAKDCVQDRKNDDRTSSKEKDARNEAAKKVNKELLHR